MEVKREAGEIDKNMEVEAKAVKICRFHNHKSFLFFKKVYKDEDQFGTDGNHKMEETEAEADNGSSSSSMIS